MAAKIGTAYSPDDEAFIREHVGNMTHAEIAAHLGRLTKSVTNKIRHLGLNGHKPQSLWSPGEIEFLRSHAATLTAEQIGDRLGRNPGTVRQAGARNGISLTGGKGGFAQQPLRLRGQVMIGGRTLIAKTCTGCGRLLPARRFSRRTDAPKRGNWEQPCRGCKIEGRNTDRPAANVASKTHRDKVDAYTRGLAVNIGEPYTSEDLEVVRDTEKSLIEVAVTIGRTYSSVAAKAQALGVNRKPNPDQHKNWIVRLAQSSVQAALELERAGLIDATGIPTEPDWDWDDNPSAVAS